MYGTQTVIAMNPYSVEFENDVEMYGTQTLENSDTSLGRV